MELPFCYSTFGTDNIGIAVGSVTSAPRCPECDAEVKVGADAVKGEIVPCPDCGAELEVRETTPVALALAPEAQEDWGE